MWPFNALKIPKEEWFQQGVPSFTPDVPFLETRPFWRVLVVDEMMQPHFLCPQLGENAEKKNIDAFTMDRFSVWKKDEGRASQVIPLDVKFTTMPYTHIRGQLWKVPTERLYVLDSFKKNGVEFIRKRVQIAIPFHYTEYNSKGEPNTRRFMDTSLRAWMYVGNSDLWKPSLLRGTKISITKASGKIVGRMIDGKTYYPVNTYVPKNPLLTEAYYYYAKTEYFGE